LLAATTGLLISQGEAKALNLKTFDLQWSPQPGSQGAINGKITLDLDSISLPSNGFDQPIPAWATALSVVVSGTGGNNGTFVQSDFDSLVLDNNAISFDFSKDLVGQGGWGTSCSVKCDFNLFSGLGPSGIDYFKLTSGSDAFVLSKFAPAGANTGVPVPGPMPVVGAVAAFGWSRRLRKRIATPLSTPPQA
jgi:hypothetical protein